MSFADGSDPFRNTDGTFTNLPGFGAGRAEQHGAGVGRDDDQASAEWQVRRAREAQGLDPDTGNLPPSRADYVPQAQAPGVAGVIFRWFFVYPLLIMLAAYVLLLTAQMVDRQSATGGLAQLAADGVLAGRTLQSPAAYLNPQQLARLMPPAELARAARQALAEPLRMADPRFERLHASAYVCGLDPVCKREVTRLDREAAIHVETLAWQFLKIQIRNAADPAATLGDYCLYPLKTGARPGTLNGIRARCRDMQMGFKPAYRGQAPAIADAMDRSLPMRLVPLLAF